MDLNSIFFYIFYGTAAIFIPLKIIVVVYVMIDNAKKAKAEELKPIHLSYNTSGNNQEFQRSGIIHINPESGKIAEDYYHLREYRVHGSGSTDSGENQLICTDYFWLSDNWFNDAKQYEDSLYDGNDYEFAEDGYENNFAEPEILSSPQIVTSLRKPAVRNRVNKYLFRENFNLNYRG